MNWSKTGRNRKVLEFQRNTQNKLFLLNALKQQFSPDISHHQQWFGCKSLILNFTANLYGLYYYCPISQIRKLRPREVESLAQSHTAGQLASARSALCLRGCWPPVHQWGLGAGLQGPYLCTWSWGWTKAWQAGWSSAELPHRWRVVARPREVQSSIRVASESWRLLSRHCRAK